MTQKNLVVLFGGCSPEYPVSLESAGSVLEYVDHSRYRVLPVGITREGDWYYYAGDLSRIKDDTWQEDGTNCHAIAFSQNRSRRGFYAFIEKRLQFFEADLALPVLHGENGEDGTVQGLFTLIGIPVVGCGVLASALCMDKYRAHQLVAASGIAVPRGVVVSSADAILPDNLHYPLFVKPVHAGSSFGISKVTAPEALSEAIALALTYDTTAIVEEAIDGFEVGCAVLGTGTLKVGRVDEISLATGFFDYKEKYTLETAKIHMPARIDALTEKRVQETARTIYRVLGCSGFARVDLFLQPNDRLVFNEVNTIPGMTAHSRYPNMMKGAGLSFSAMLAELLALYEEEG